MTERGRPWWNVSPVEAPVRQSHSVVVKHSPVKTRTMTPIPGDTGVPACTVKTESRNSFPSFSPHGKPPAFSPHVKQPRLSPNGTQSTFSMFGNGTDLSKVKSETLTNLKSEPMAYLERALVKGEFPQDFNWPLLKWDPLTQRNPSVKKETKHYIPNPYQSIFNRLDGKFKFAQPQRRRTGPPPDWHYIYSRETHEPTGAARAWWNGDVERALNKRREAYLLTKQRDNAPVEVRMERLWWFEVAKDEARRVIDESKLRASVGDDSVEGLNIVNYGASSSKAYQESDSGSTCGNQGLSVKERLGKIVTIDEDETLEKEKEEASTKDQLEQPTTDEVEVLPRDKDNVEVYTISDEIEEAMFNSDDDDSEDIIVISEGNSEVIFVQKKQGEVSFLAQVEGRLVKMNRKRKLCVTVNNTGSAKRSRIVTVDTEQSNGIDGKEEEEKELSGMPDSAMGEVQNGESGTETLFLTDTESQDSATQVYLLTESGTDNKEREVDTDIAVESDDLASMVETDAPVDARDSFASTSLNVEPNLMNFTPIDEEENMDVEDVTTRECVEVETVGDSDVGVESVSEEDDEVVAIVLDAVSSVDVVEDVDSVIEEEDSMDSVAIVENDVDLMGVMEKDVDSIAVVKKVIDTMSVVDDDIVVEDAVCSTAVAEENVEVEIVDENRDLEDTVQEEGDVIVDDKSDAIIIESNKDQISFNKCDKQNVDTTESVNSRAEDISVIECDEIKEASFDGAENIPVQDCKVDAVETRYERGGDIALLAGKESQIVSENRVEEEISKQSEDVLEIDLESEEGTFNDIRGSIVSESSPQRKGIIAKQDDDDDDSNSDIQVVETIDKEIVVLKATINVTPKKKEVVDCVDDEPSLGNAAANMGGESKVNTRQTRQSAIGSISTRSTRQRANISHEGQSVLSRLKGGEVKESPGKRKVEKNESPQKVQKTEPQSPSRYGFRNRSKRF